MPPKVTVLDWGGGNLFSLLRAFERAGAHTTVTADPDRIRLADRLVFPGVGAFGAVMERLRTRGLDEVLRERLQKATHPFLGICVGMQALFRGSEESPGAIGISLIEETVTRLQARKVPHVGWNEVVPTDAMDPVLQRGYAYFVNSYAAPVPDSADWVAATTDHEGHFASAVRRGPILAVQFHPEKSARYGAELIARWLAC